MYIETVPNRHSRPTLLLRQGWRDGKNIRKRTLANLTHWPEEKVEALVPPQSLFVIDASLPHGAVEAVLGTMRTIGLDSLIASKACPQRNLIMAMVAEQLIHPSSKLGTTRLWQTTTLADQLGVGEADEDDLYDATDWPLARQARMGKKLATRHLSPGAHVLYDVTRSSYEGYTCSLARFGHNRDQKQCVVLVGDRGTLTQTQIDTLKQYPGLGWISALRFEAIRKLADHHGLPTTLFEPPHLAEITSADFPPERLVACFNPLLATERRRKRHELLEATEHDLAKIAREVARRTRKPLSPADIGKKVGQVLYRYKVAKHF